MQVFDLMQELIVVTRLDDGSIFGVNKAFEAALGISKRRAQGKTSVDLTFWVDLKQRDEYFKAAAKKRSVRDFSATLRDPSGRHLDGLLDASCIEEDGVCYVVTVIKKVKLARPVSQTDSRLMRMFEQSPVPMAYVRREESSQTFYNRAWFTAFGFDMVKDQGKSGLELGIWVEPTHRAQIVEQASQGRETIAEEVRMLDAKGNQKWISYTVRLAKDNDTLLFLISYLDITAHKASSVGDSLAEAASREEQRRIERRTADNRRGVDRHVKLNALDAVAKEVIAGRDSVYMSLRREERLYVAMAANSCELLKTEEHTIAQALCRIGIDWTAELASRWEFPLSAGPSEASSGS